MSKKSNNPKRQLARMKQKRAKRLAQFKRFCESFVADPYEDRCLPLFEEMLNGLHTLNVKTLQVAFEFLSKEGYIYRWSGEFHRILLQHLEYEITAKTLLKE